MKRLYATLLDDEVPMHRLETCAHYDKCLTIACMKKWASFSCRACEDFEFSGPIFLNVPTRKFFPAMPPSNQGFTNRKKRRTKDVTDYDFLGFFRKL